MNRLLARTTDPAPIAIMTLTLSLLTAGLALSASTPDKMDRQVGIMEQVLQKTLIDSPNWLVHSETFVTGVYLPDFGVVLSCPASLNDETIFLNGRIIVHKRGSDWNPFVKQEKAKEEKSETPPDPAALYEKGKDEIVQMLLDFGETLSALPNGQDVVVAMRLGDGDFFREKKIKRVVFKAKIDDLREYAADRLSESAMKSRIEIDE